MVGIVSWAVMSALDDVVDAARFVECGGAMGASSVCLCCVAHAACPLHVVLVCLRTQGY